MYTVIFNSHLFNSILTQTTLNFAKLHYFSHTLISGMMEFSFTNKLEGYRVHITPIQRLALGRRARILYTAVNIHCKEQFIFLFMLLILHPFLSPVLVITMRGRPINVSEGAGKTLICMDFSNPFTQPFQLLLMSNQSGMFI